MGEGEARMRLTGTTVMAVLLAAVLVGSPAMASGAEALSWGDNADQDLLPGWTMYFIDSDESQDLVVKVTQADPGGELEVEPAIGWGYLGVEGARGFFRVEEASWSEWPDNQGYPESAVVYGRARLGFCRSVDFELDLISHYFPTRPRVFDEAVLKIDLNGNGECGDLQGEVTGFRGQLHHSRLRALF
jgi:hypothetical protein